MPINLLLTIVISIAKWLIERKAGKRLNDKEFLEHIAVHVVLGQNAGKAANEFDKEMEELQKKLMDENGNG